MSRARALAPWAVVAAGIAAVIVVVAWPGLAPYTVGAAAGLLLAVMLRRLIRGRKTRTADDLTTQEARDLADDLSLQLYRAQDALAFVQEMCDIADRQGRQPTTTDIRQWIKGAQCARQTGLVLRPDASGRDPETVQATPDTTGEHTTDQGGDDPDTLRNRVATAIRTALKARTVPPIVDFLGQPIRGTEIGLTEYDLADVALAAIQDTYVPPPPGSDRDALPPDLRALIAPHMPEYLSTGCETAHACQVAAEHHPARAGELWHWARREHASCRLTRKQDMAGCGCSCHNDTARP